MCRIHLQTLALPEYHTDYTKPQTFLRQYFIFIKMSGIFRSLEIWFCYTQPQGGHSCVGNNGYVRLTGISFSAFYEQEGCTKMGTTEQEGSLKWCSDEPMGPRVRSTDTLEQEGVNNLKHVTPHCKQQEVCFSWIHEWERVGGLAV